jgi:hypothetical protein
MSAFAVRIASLAIALLAIALGVPAGTALAEGPPTLNVATSCEAAARGAIVAGRDREACMSDERAARDILAKAWDKYAPADKTQCVGMNNQGGPASYVELLSCLEIMRDAKSIRETDALAPPAAGQQDETAPAAPKRPAPKRKSPPRG